VKSTYSELCGEKCRDKLHIQLRKNAAPKTFCTNCFNLLEGKTIAEIKEKIRKSNGKSKVIKRIVSK
jgi:hypothetical protein